MDILYILRQGWSITWRRWELWALLFATFLVFTPSVLFLGAITVLSVLLREPGVLALPAWLEWANDMNDWSWIGLFIVTLLALVFTTILSVILQAGAARIAAYSAEGVQVSLGEALSFTRPQLRRIMRLGLIFGAVNGVIALLPSVLSLILPEGPFRDALLGLLQTSFSPLSVIFGIIFLVLLVSIAIEDLVPRAVARPVDIFRTGWWGFLLVVALSFVAGIIVAAAVTIPLVPVIVLNLIFPNAIMALLPCYGLVAGLFLFALLLASVYTFVLYTLVYRAAAAQGLAAVQPSP